MKSTKATRLLAKQVLNFIKQHPEVHDQDSYIGGTRKDSLCGTTMCIAGTAGFLVNGLSIKATEKAVAEWDENWDSYAGHLLGLNEDEATALFQEFDNGEAIRKLKNVAKGKPLYS